MYKAFLIGIAVFALALLFSAAAVFAVCLVVVYMAWGAAELTTVWQIIVTGLSTAVMVGTGSSVLGLYADAKEFVHVATLAVKEGKHDDKGV